ncbi:hypothetical protein EGR_11241 [Echinococcus granulosus]|uniref:DUF5727 domain-containing protein n=1 Tax=Echinococcus granulosus TaxID=6210 RepID=W6U6C5_ECHGR|nr:hypothetical protein EGR_11241 [Echinococcus granulosus]EUB53902.1 hypothetical protein EGR_11241 [Echinococcus granulosus]
MADEVDVQTSFPLSRFVKGQESHQINFAIGGADSNGTTVFGLNGERACEWRGHKLVRNITDLCRDSRNLLLPITKNRNFGFRNVTRSGRMQSTCAGAHHHG